MRFHIRDNDGNHGMGGSHVCGDPDHPDGFEVLGSGNSPDEALGEAVRNAYLASRSEITIDDISSK